MGLNECALIVLHIIAISYAFDGKSAQKLFPEWQQHLAYVDTLRVREGGRGEGGRSNFMPPSFPLLGNSKNAQAK